MSEQERFDRERAGSNEAERASSNEVEAHRAGQRAGSHSEEPNDEMDRNAPQNDEGDEVEGHMANRRAGSQRAGT